MKKFFLLFAAAALFACSSGGGDDPDKPNGDGNCVEALPGCETATCEGNYVRTCSEDGLHYEYEFCDSLTCKDGVCTPAACSEPEKTECKTQTEYDLCLANMTMVTTKECPEGTKCASGACVEGTCKAGEKVCGWQTVLSCNEDGQGWTSTACGEGQYCDDVSLACVDIDPFCAENLLGVRCLNQDKALHCNARGKVSEVKCGSKEVCVDGFCQPKACGVTYSDATPTDVVDGDLPGLVDVVEGEIEELITIDLSVPPEIPPLEKMPKAWVTLNGGDFEMWEIKFTSAKQANYVYKDLDLQVSMAKGSYLMEVHFSGIEEGVVGSFSSDEPGSVNVMILFNDGTTNPEEVQWKWTSVSFNATLDQFEPPGGWVKGTFSGVLEQDAGTGGGPNVELIDGSFEVPRKE
jgi:hypothetical protein